MRGNVAAALIGTSGAACLIQWSQIGYRLWLFFTYYGGELGVNHLGAGDFKLIYTANTLLLVAAALGTRLLWSHSQRWRRAGVIIGVMNALGCLTLFIMQQTGVLVDYNEFIRLMRKGA